MVGISPLKKASMGHMVNTWDEGCQMDKAMGSGSKCKVRCLAAFRLRKHPVLGYHLVMTNIANWKIHCKWGS